MTMSEKSKEVLGALARLSKVSALSINELRVVLALERLVARIEAHKILREPKTFLIWSCFMMKLKLELD